LCVSPVGAKDEILLQSDNLFPFHKSPPHKQACYISAIIHMRTYLDEGKDQLLRILIERIVKYDAYCPRDVIETNLLDSQDVLDNEVDDETVPVLTDKQAISLDIFMSLLFKHIYDETHNEAGDYDAKKGKALFREMMKIYNTHVLTTFRISHAQFLFFYLTGLDTKLALQFLEINWSLFTNPNTANIHRQMAVAYIASYVSRSVCVSVAMTKACLERLTNWIHGYIRNSNVSNSLDFMYTNLKSHGHFYAACQAAFYIFAFRHQELTADPLLLKFVQSLGFSSIVTSQLNPLRVCLPGVVRNFSSIARNYQLAYCQTVIERNNRINLPVVGNLSSANVSGKPLLLDCFFPFDPFLLPRSKHWLKDMYREYQGDSHSDSEEEVEEEDEDVEEEDESQRQRSRHNSCGSIRSTRSRSDSTCIPDFLLYETTPGFKKI